MPSRSASKAEPSRAVEIPELSRQLLQAQEEERGRISRELHDETGQALMVLRFQMEMLLSEIRTQAQREKIQESLELLDRTIEGLRRTIARLSPRVLDELGLVAAIRRQAQLLAKRAGIHAHLELPEDAAALDHDLEVALYRSVQEALHNIAKHARARNFTIRLTITSSRIALQVADDGVGFMRQTSQQRGFGLTGMRERAAALGGWMAVRSQPDRGTRIRITFPIGRDVRPRESSSTSLAHGSAA